MPLATSDELSMRLTVRTSHIHNDYLLKEPGSHSRADLLFRVIILYVEARPKVADLAD